MQPIEGLKKYTNLLSFCGFFDVVTLVWLEMTSAFNWTTFFK